MEKNKTVDAFLDATGIWREALTLLREILLSTAMEETIKWGHPVYTIGNKNIVGIGAFQSYAGLWFFQGTLLKDQAKKLLNAQEGVTKAQRQWRFQSVEEIREDRELILQYVAEAIANQEKGKVIKPAKNKPLLIPEELEMLFKTDPQVRQSFEELSLTNKRDFVEYIATAKQAATSQKRLEKIRPMILEGIGLNDRYK